jgi:hypothetical protein
MQIGATNAACADLDQHLIVARLRHGHVGQAQGLSSAVEQHGAHGRASIAPIHLSPTILPRSLGATKPGENEHGIAVLALCVQPIAAIRARHARCVACLHDGLRADTLEVSQTDEPTIAS